MTDLAYRATGHFWAELAACGVNHVVVSPGSRSTPLAITARHQPNLQVTVQLDERVAGFFALGAAKATARPVALVCTSGTAAANYLPAVVEASHAGVPLILCTADRPPELRAAGAGQTIDQTKLYGDSVRWFAETPCDVDAPHYFARLAVRAATMAAAGPDPGPVHLNWPFRKPLEPQGPLPQCDPTVGSPIAPVRPCWPADVDEVAVHAGRRGVIVAGALNITNADADAIVSFAHAAGWPIVADAGSQLRGRTPLVLDGAEWVLPRSTLNPEVLVRIGGPPSNRAVINFVAQCDAQHRLLVDPRRRWEDPSFTWTSVLSSDPAALLAAATGSMRPTDSTWAEAWQKAAHEAWLLADQELARHPLLEPRLVTTLLNSLPPQVPVYGSNSMPVRDLTTFWPPNASPRRMLVNRGANGIDGVVSSALGTAVALNAPVVALVGDIAFLHDIGGLIAAARSGADLTVVVPNNNGGGIFSLLPVATTEGAHFDELFHTPHNTDLAQVAALSGVSHHRVTEAEQLAKALNTATGVTVIEVPVDHAAALAQRRRITDLFR